MMSFFDPFIVAKPLDRGETDAYVAPLAMSIVVKLADKTIIVQVAKKEFVAT